MTFTEWIDSHEEFTQPLTARDKFMLYTGWLARQDNEPNFSKIDETQCPICNSIVLIPYSSFHYKQCQDCGTKIPWLLDEKEQPLIKHQR